MEKTETVEFYNKESGNYSDKRYYGPLVTYFQFLFRRRLSICLEFLERITAQRHGLRLLEIGCADGVVLRKIHDHFPGVFERMVGIDIAAEMIVEAQRRNAGRNTSYYVRGEEPSELVDIVLELGVHPFDLKGEIELVALRLKSGGHFIYSLSTRDSLHARIKLKDKDYYGDYCSYVEYENAMEKHFTIVRKIPYGLFIPKLWSIPMLARIFQPILESATRSLVPNLYHEQIYILQKKD